MALSKWLKSSKPAEVEACLPDGLRIYAVGDVHGRADLLARLLDLVAQDLAERPAPRPLTIFLGDYVDRGPQSSAVIDRLSRRDCPTPLLALRGNHEDLFIGFLCGTIDLAYYMQIGGGPTLASYGIDPDVFERASDADRNAILLSAVPDPHCMFLDELRLSETVGDYFFCHAGVRPGIPLDRQSPDDLLWIREEFLKSTANFGKVVVHGHTPVREPVIRPNAINIDTYAVGSGVLTAAVLEGRELRFLRTQGG